METMETMRAKYDGAVMAEEQAEEGWRSLLDRGLDSHLTDMAWEEVLNCRDLRDAYGAICELIGGNLDK